MAVPDFQKNEELFPAHRKSREENGRKFSNLAKETPGRPSQQNMDSRKNFHPYLPD